MAREKGREETRKADSRRVCHKSNAKIVIRKDPFAPSISAIQSCLLCQSYAFAPIPLIHSSPDAKQESNHFLRSLDCSAIISSSLASKMSYSSSVMKPSSVSSSSMGSSTKSSNSSTSSSQQARLVSLYGCWKLETPSPVWGRSSDYPRPRPWAPP